MADHPGRARRWGHTLARASRGAARSLRHHCAGRRRRGHRRFAIGGCRTTGMDPRRGTRRHGKPRGQYVTRFGGRVAPSIRQELRERRERGKRDLRRVGRGQPIADWEWRSPVGYRHADEKRARARGDESGVTSPYRNGPGADGSIGGRSIASTTAARMAVIHGLSSTGPHTANANRPPRTSQRRRSRS